MQVESEIFEYFSNRFFLKEMCRRNIFNTNSNFFGHILPIFRTFFTSQMLCTRCTTLAYLLPAASISLLTTEKTVCWLQNHCFGLNAPCECCVHHDKRSSSGGELNLEKPLPNFGEVWVQPQETSMTPFGTLMKLRETSVKPHEMLRT